MIRFNLNIDLFYETESRKRGLETKAIVCLEYPVIHLIAKTLETSEEEYDHLDRFILSTVRASKGYRLGYFSFLTGLSQDIFRYRVRELERQKYVVLDGEQIYVTDNGISYVDYPATERRIERTRSILLDGISHEPLLNHFYKEGQQSLIREDERDASGNKVFNPSLIHNPPKDVQGKILQVPVEQRAQYNLPVGLKEILDYDFALMTYPVAVIMSVSKEGKVLKRLIDCTGFYAEEANIKAWQERLSDEIEKLGILVEEWEDRGTRLKKFQFKSTWGKLGTHVTGRIFDLTLSKIAQFVERQYNVQGLTGKHLKITEYAIQFMVNEELFSTERIQKKKLIESCLRKRDYFWQPPTWGVSHVFLEVLIADTFVQKRVDVYKQILDDVPMITLLSQFNYDFNTLRKCLIDIERLDALENLDMLLFVGSRENEFEPNKTAAIHE